jgi:D-alanyl-D-alanine carboxypeptidase (penicillin-binding protein 5/6)
MTLTGAALAVETTAKQAIVVDYDTGNVLYAKNADETVGPASMTKMMTIYLLFERLKDGRLSLESELPVSEKAWRMGGSKMWVEVGKTAKVEDLIRGIVVQSGNDATIVVAEGLAGTEEAFADEMTARARSLGDLAVLAMATVRDFPEYYHYYAEKEFVYSKIKQPNRNPLLYKNIGADGLKTGHTEASGYGLTGSAIRDGRRIVVVVHGMGATRERSEQSERLLSWAFREWGQYALFESGETVAQVPVWLGASETVPAVMRDKLLVSVPRKARKGMQVKLVHKEAVPSPIAKGDEIAMLVVSAKGMEDIEVPVYAGADVERGGFFGNFGAAISYLLRGMIS